MLVTVQHPFSYLGRTVQPGTRIEVEPLQATILRRAGVITLSDGLPTSAPRATVEPFEPDPDPEVEADLAADRDQASRPDGADDAASPPAPRRRIYKRRDVASDDTAGSPPPDGRPRTYKRRDLTAEAPDGE